MVSMKTQYPPRSAVDERPALEAIIDEIIEDTFPASDPPAWGAVAARIERMEDED
jgi:hypothetical protein